MTDRCDVLTITPNPSLDLLHEAEHIVWDDANRTDPPRRRAGGQGVNLARSALALGGVAHALLPLGGRTGDELAAFLARARVPFTAVPVAAETRTFVAVRETGTGRNLLLNPRGGPLQQDEWHALIARADLLMAELEPQWVACSGSLPPGAPPDLYARIGELATARGSRFVADCDGEPLQLAARSCDLLCPNLHEAERLTGLTVRDAVTARAAARRALELGPSLVAITLGGAGAVLVSHAHELHAQVRVAPAAGGSAVGAGDSFLAALILALNRAAPHDEALCDAVAAGAAVLAGSGTDLMNLNAFPALRAAVELVELI